jgi:hypothetical protein
MKKLIKKILRENSLNIQINKIVWDFLMENTTLVLSSFNNVGVSFLFKSPQECTINLYNHLKSEGYKSVDEWFKRTEDEDLNNIFINIDHAIEKLVSMESTQTQKEIDTMKEILNIIRKIKHLVGEVDTKLKPL